MYEELKRASIFSDKEYLSLDELKARFNLPDITPTWEKVKEYRSLFRYDLAIKTPEKNPYYITLNRLVLNKVSSLERKFFLICAKFSGLSKKGQKKFNNESLKLGLRWISDNYRLGLSNIDISSIVNGQYNSDEPKLKILKNYLKMSEGLNNICSLDYSNLLNNINNYLLGNLDQTRLQYRNIDEKDNDFLSNKDLLQGELNDLLIFLNGNESISFILKVIAFLYQYTYLCPCSYFNQETGSLLTKCYLSSTIFPNSGQWFPTESLYFSFGGNMLDRAKLSLKTGDLTYFVISSLDLLDMNLNNIERSLNDIEENDISDKIAEEENLKNVNSSSSLIKEDSIGYKKYDSMAPKAENFNDDEVYHMGENNITMASVSSYSTSKYPKESKNSNSPLNDEIVKLMEKHPVLKWATAHFYVTHRTIGSFYTISQFKTIENVAYETARTSMDLLANLGFYKKSKTAKKFIYSPIPKGVI